MRRAAKGEGLAFVKNVVSKHESDECLIWPFTLREGYPGFVIYEGRQILAHVAVCLEYVGSKPSPDHEVAHSCGQSACVNKRHVSWKTHKENMQDKQAHGTSLAGKPHYKYEFTRETVIELRRTGDFKKFLGLGASIRAIRNAYYGKTWKALPSVQELSKMDQGSK